MAVTYPTAELRLVFACALIKTIHEADMATLLHPVWTVPTTGERVLYVQTPLGHRARLPIESFDNQITGKLYNPKAIQVLLGRYKTIIGDEWQDYSKSKYRLDRAPHGAVLTGSSFN